MSSGPKSQDSLHGPPWAGPCIQGKCKLLIYICKAFISIVPGFATATRSYLNETLSVNFKASLEAGSALFYKHKMKMCSRNPPKDSHGAEMGIPWFPDAQRQPWLMVPQRAAWGQKFAGNLIRPSACAMMLSTSKEPVNCIPVGDIKLHPWFCLLHRHPHHEHNNMTREGADWGRLLPVPEAGGS